MAGTRGGHGRLRLAHAPGASDERFPQFSPTGALALISDRQHIPGEASPYRYALSVDGAKVADDVHPGSPPRWSPDGTRIAVAAGGECRRLGIELVDPAAPRRPAKRVSNLCRFVGGGNDVLHGTAYLDFLRGLSGNDRIFGGAGNDRIEARDGVRDVIDCGPGRDVAEVDRLDVVRH